MFSPNTDSFVLIRRTVVTRSFPVFPHVLLPNTHSFLLTRRTIVEPRLAPEAGNEAVVIPQSVESVESTDSEQIKVSDQGKRNFLKVAGIAGAGLVVSQLSPNKAHALIMGSSPTTGVVGVKNAANARINPATEESVSALSGLTFDAGSLQVKVTSVSGEGSSSFSDSGNVAKSALVDAARHVQVDVLSSALPTSASTEATLQTISTENTLEAISYGGVQFALRLATVGDIDYVGEAVVGSGGEGDAVWRIKKIDSSSGVVIKWADGDANLNNTWTGYAGYTYS